MVKTTQQNLDTIKQMTDNIENLMVNLYCRWLDEKDYEDINDYLVVIKKEVPSNIIISKMNKRPFGFNFSFGGEAQYQYYVKSNSIGWKRTK
jgi:hypothetical protein